MLTTNMIRKDISSHNQYDASLALTGLACFMTPDLARDLANDVLALMSSSRPYLRKKAVLVMYKVFLKVHVGKGLYTHVSKYDTVCINPMENCQKLLKGLG